MRRKARRSACFIIRPNRTGTPWDSCLMQDEPEVATGFSRKMSLKGKFGMLGIDYQHGRHRGHEPGADSGVPGGQRRGAVCRPAARGGVRVGGEDVRGAPVE